MMKFRDIFSIDPRSLALFRIALGTILFLDILSRWNHFAAFYSESGILPSGLAEADGPWYFQLYFWNSSDLYTHALFGLTLLAAICLIAGWRSQSAAFVCWILFGALSLRNELILNSGDRLFLLLLLWACLLPLGARWSLDARKAPQQPKPSLYFSSATVGLFLQMFFLYFSAALSKAGQPNWLNGSHLYFTMNRDEFLTPFGLWIAQFETLLMLTTWSVLVLQGIGCFLLLLPYRFGKGRFLVIATFAALQAGMGLALYIGFFPAVAVAGSLALLPPWFWEKFRSHASLFERLRTFADAAFREKPERAHAPSSTGSLTTGIREGLAALLVALLVFLNVNEHARLLDKDSAPHTSLIKPLAFKQSWNMFSSPVLYSGWFVVEADLRDGRRINLLNGNEPATEEKPPVVIRDFRNYRWRILLTSRLRSDSHEDVRLYLLQYYMNEWNRNTQSQDERVARAALIEYRYFIDPGYRFSEPKAHVLAESPADFESAGRNE